MCKKKKTPFHKIYLGRLFLLFALEGETKQIEFFQTPIQNIHFPLSFIQAPKDENNLYLFTYLLHFFLNPTKTNFNLDKCCELLYTLLFNINPFLHESNFPFYSMKRKNTMIHNISRNADPYICLIRIFYLVEKFSFLFNSSSKKLHISFPENWLHNWLHHALCNQVTYGYYYNLFREESQTDLTIKETFQSICSYVIYDINKFEILYYSALIKNIQHSSSSFLPENKLHHIYRIEEFPNQYLDLLSKQFQHESKFGDFYPFIPFQTRDQNLFYTLFHLKRSI